MNTEMNTNKELKSQQDMLGTTDNNKYIFKNVENSPFMLVKDVELGYYCVCGKHRITNLHKTEEEALKELNANNINWSAVTAYVINIIEQQIEINKVKEN